ncbi:M4 family metallopeptidase [Veronia nyctiphanis]|nr:M4 family metallopeptidase [Veronia nyctiphanis]
MTAIDDPSLLPDATHPFHSRLRAQPSGFQLEKVLDLPNGKAKYIYHQLHNGIPVRNAKAISEFTQGKHNVVRGQMMREIGIEGFDALPSMDGKKAMEISSKGISGTPMYPYVEAENEKSELFIWMDKNDQARLVYVTNYFLPARKPSRPYAIVDAKTGEVLKRWEGLAHAQEFGQGPGGNTKTGQYYFGLDYPGFMVEKSGNQCTMSNQYVSTVNLNHSTSGNTPYTYTCNDSLNTNTVKSINGAYSPLNDAHFFGKLVFDMYKDWFNLAPLSFKLVMRVHYGNGYENAFWNGSSMTFGDGGSYFYPLVDVNVSAHEVSHGFTEQNSDLDYFGMSGGINEAFSDIAGEAAEFYWKGTVDWVVGRDITKSAGGLRYFIDPTDDGVSIGHASQYTDGMDVHYSSGVFNRAFYLLSEEYGWGVKKAFEVFVLANRTYWTSSTDFDEGGCGVKNAASDLGYDTSDVENAFNQVGVYPCRVLTTLNAGVPISGLSGDVDDELYFSFSLTSNTDSASVTLAGGTGNADLMIKYGTPPQSGSYDCLSDGSDNTESCSVPLQGPGQYYAVVKGISVFSGVTINLESTILPPQVLEIDKPIVDIYGAKGDEQFYSFTMPADLSSLRVNTVGGTGDVDLYVKKGSLPSKTDYDCRPFRYGNTESCEVDDGEGTEYFVMLHAYSTYDGVTLSLLEGDLSDAEGSAVAVAPGEPVSNLSGNIDDKFYFVLNVSDFRSNNLSQIIQATLSLGSGDPDLYIRKDKAPTQFEYDCRSIGLGTAESCTVDASVNGNYYVMIYGANSFNGVTLQVNRSAGGPNPSSDQSSGSSGGAIKYILLASFLLLFRRRSSVTVRIVT